MEFSTKHPINVAYEAATADIKDQNMIDYFHLEKYGITAVNYNRDLETFPILKDILYSIMGENIYYSPTDMGVNVIKDCITDDELAKQSAKDEVIRRYYKSIVDYKKGLVDETVSEKIKILMNELDISESDRAVVRKAIEKKEKTNLPCAAIQIGKRFITGKKTELLSPVSSTILNAIKCITKIPDDVDLLSANILEPILDLKDKMLNFKETTLKVNEVLIALSICSATNPIVAKALKNLSKLEHAQMHATYMISDEELIVLNNLGVNVTCDPDSDIH